MVHAFLSQNPTTEKMKYSKANNNRERGRQSKTRAALEVGLSEVMAGDAERAKLVESLDALRTGGGGDGLQNKLYDTLVSLRYDNTSLLMCSVGGGGGVVRFSVATSLYGTECGERERRSSGTVCVCVWV